MPRTIKMTVYTYDELTPEAQQRARDWWRDGGLDYEWWDFIYDDFERVCDILGIELDREQTGPAKVRVYFSGFYHQGQGASFDGRYDYNPGAAKAIREYAPGDIELHDIADVLQDAQRRNFFQIKADTETVRGNTMRVYSARKDDVELTVDTEDVVADALTDLAAWLFKTLRAEYEYLMSDEAVADTILANEYEFTADGAHA